MARRGRKASNAQHPPFDTLSDGLERSRLGEGDPVAPDRTEVRENRKRVARREGNASNAQRQRPNTLSDGLVRLMRAEGANVAPDRTEVSEDQEKMAPAEGFEPPTFGLQNRCSTS